MCSPTTRVAFWMSRFSAGARTRSSDRAIARQGSMTRPDPAAWWLAPSAGPAGGGLRPAARGGRWRSGGGSAPGRPAGRSDRRRTDRRRPADPDVLEAGPPRLDRIPDVAAVEQDGGPHDLAQPRVVGLAQLVPLGDQRHGI